MKKLLLILIALILWAGSSWGQISGYTFTSAAGTYTEITGGTIIATASSLSGAGSLDDVIYTLADGTIPFNFGFNGTNYTGLRVSTNGFITFGTTAPATNLYSPISSTAAYAGCIAAIGRDLNALYNVGGYTGEIRYETLSSTPDRIFVIQYKNFRPYSTSGVAPYWRWNFQIRLYETSNVIKFVYDFNFSGVPTASTAQVGLRGANNSFPGSINNRLITSGTHTWATSVPGTTNASTCAYSTTLLPASGLTYTFTPPNPCSGTPTPGNTLSTANPACPGVNFTLSLQNTTPGTGITYQWQSSLTGGAPWTNLGTAAIQVTSQIAPTWYQCVVTCATSGFSETSNPLQVTMYVAGVPYSEGFITTTTPSCWNTTGWSIGSVRGVTGNPGNNIYKNLYNSATTGTFSTCNIGPLGAGMQLTFDYKLANYTSPYDPPASGSGNYIVSVSTDGGGTYTPLETVTNNGVAGWQAKSYPLTAYVGSNIMIKIVGTWISGDYDLAFDNLKVDVAPACIAPSGLYCDNLSSSGARLNWVSPDSFFDIFIDISGNPAPGPGTSPTVNNWNGTSYTWSGGIPNTAYNWWVRTDCAAGGGTGQSDWIAGTSFTTLCLTAVLPFNESYNAATFPACWSQTFSGGLNSNRWSVSTTALAGGTANEMKNSYQNATGISRLITPAINMSTATNGVYLAFNTLIDDYGVGATLKIQTSTNLVNWTDEAWSYATTSNINVGPMTVTLQILNNISTTTYIAFVIEGNHYQYDFWYIDNIAVQDGPFVIPGLWKGTLSTDWFTPGNWDDGNVPVASTNVTIPAGCPNYPYISTPGGICNNMNIQAGGKFYMIDSFLDVFFDITVAGDLDISGGTLNVGQYLFAPTATSKVTMSNGILNTDGIFQNAAYTWSPGLFTFSGGTINQAGTAFFYGGTGSTMSGNFVYNVGGTLQTSHLMWTMTGGTINLIGTESSTNYFLAPSNEGTAIAYNLNVNSTTPYVFTRNSASLQNLQIVNDFSILAGDVNLGNGFGFIGTCSIGGNVNLLANNTANLTIPWTTTFTTSGNFNQHLAGGQYGSLIGFPTVGGEYNLNMDFNPLASGKWILISPPIAGAKASNFLCQYLMKHDPITNTWIDVTDPNEPLSPGVDYALWVHPDPITIPPDQNCGTAIVPLTGYTWTGILNSGPVTIPLLCDDPMSEGWNNVGNPYQAAIDWNASGWVKTNVNDAVYIENNGIWASFVGGVGTNGGTQYIAPGQGFFVQCNDIAGGSLTFDPSVRTHTRAPFMKSSIPGMVRLKASGNNRSDETVIRFNESATNGFDGTFDARKIMSDLISTTEVPQIFSMDNNMMSINTLPATDKVAVGFSAGQSGEFTISAPEINDLPCVLLEDLNNGQVTDLQVSAYTFTFSKGDNEGRFIAHFTPIGINDPATHNFIVYSDVKKIFVVVPEQTMGTIEVSNLLGQVITTTPIQDGKTAISVNESGYYIVRVMSNDMVDAKKVFVK
jgi:hypothetical protein